MTKNEAQNEIDRILREYLEENDLEYVQVDIEIELDGDTYQHKWDEE